jgi:hypothetical protein
VIDHSVPLAEQVAAFEIGAPAFVFSTTQTHRHLKEIVALIAPQGRFGLIDDPEGVDISGFKRKSVSTHCSACRADERTRPRRRSRREAQVAYRSE